MCFSARSSIISFTVGIVGALLCTTLGTVSDRIVGFFLGFVASMQGIEYLLWTHQECDDYNRLVSKIGMILNHLQPIVLGIVLLYLNSNNMNNHFILLLMAAYLFVIVPYSQQFLDNPDIECTVKRDDNEHLRWRWNEMENYQFVYIFFLMTLVGLCLLGFPKFEYGMYGAIVTMFSFLTSTIFYSNAVGALWCYYTVYVPIIYYFLRKVVITKI